MSASPVYSTALAGADRAIVTRDSRDDARSGHRKRSTSTGSRSRSSTPRAGATRSTSSSREGVARGEQARGVADLVLLVLDRSEPLTHDDEHLLADTAKSNRIIVSNKSDLRRPTQCGIDQRTALRQECRA